MCFVWWYLRLMVDPTKLTIHSIPFILVFGEWKSLTLIFKDLNNSKMSMLPKVTKFWLLHLNWDKSILSTDEKSSGLQLLQAFSLKTESSTLHVTQSRPLVNRDPFKNVSTRYESVSHVKQLFLHWTQEKPSRDCFSPFEHCSHSIEPPPLFVLK